MKTQILAVLTAALEKVVSVGILVGVAYVLARYLPFNPRDYPLISSVALALGVLGWFRLDEWVCKKLQSR